MTRTSETRPVVEEIVTVTLNNNEMSDILSGEMSMIHDNLVENKVAPFIVDLVDNVLEKFSTNVMVEMFVEDTDDDTPVTETESEEKDNG